MLSMHVTRKGTTLNVTESTDQFIVKTICAHNHNLKRKRTLHVMDVTRSSGNID